MRLKVEERCSLGNTAEVKAVGTQSHGWLDMSPRGQATHARPKTHRMGQLESRHSCARCPFMHWCTVWLQLEACTGASANASGHKASETPVRIVRIIALVHCVVAAKGLRGRCSQCI